MGNVVWAMPIACGVRNLFLKVSLKLSCLCCNTAKKYFSQPSLALLTNSLSLTQAKAMEQLPVVAEPAPVRQASTAAGTACSTFSFHSVPNWCFREDYLYHGFRGKRKLLLKHFLELIFSRYIPELQTLFWSNNLA